MIKLSQLLRLSFVFGIIIIIVLSIVYITNPRDRDLYNDRQKFAQMSKMRDELLSAYQFKKKAKVLKNKSTKNILIWSEDVRHVWGPNFPPSVWTDECSTQCSFTYDRSKLSEADIVLFLYEPTYEIAQTKKAVYAVMNLEPYYNILPKTLPAARDRFSKYLDHTDILISYFNKSDIQITYSYGLFSDCPHDDNYDIEKCLNYHGVINRLPDLSTRINKNLLAFVSNCLALERKHYLKELGYYMNIDNYGSCLQTKISKEKKYVLQKFYKYELVFENTNELDYISEKIFNAISGGTLPIYFGTSSLKHIGLEKFYIDANDFKSPSDLADYIRYLNANDSAYLNYFTWRLKPLPQKFLDYVDKNFVKRKNNWICRLCEYYNKNF
jgi:hypothetical protein